MLVLHRKEGEKVVVYDRNTLEVLLTVLVVPSRGHGQSKRLGFECRDSIGVDREEIFARRLASLGQ